MIERRWREGVFCENSRYSSELFHPVPIVLPPEGGRAEGRRGEGQEGRGGRVDLICDHSLTP